MVGGVDEAPSGSGGAPRSRTTPRTPGGDPGGRADRRRETRPSRPVACPIAGEGGRVSGSWISSGLHETIRAHGRPLAWIAGKQTTLSSTIRDGCSSSKISRRRSSAYARAVAESAECGLDERLELLDRRRPEHRGGLPNEVLPELAGCLLHLGRRAEAQQPLIEALGLEVRRRRLLDDENDAVAPLAQHLPDAAQLLVGPCAPSGEKTMVTAWLTVGRRCRSCGTSASGRREVDRWRAKLRDPSGEVKVRWLSRSLAVGVTRCRRSRLR